MSIRPPPPSGPVPEWLAVETAGWPLRDALITRTQDRISSAVCVDKQPSRFIDHAGNERWECGRMMPTGRSPALMPLDILPWWEVSDIHTPALLYNLLSGRLVAFGDPGRTGAQPHWIAPRDWQHLKFEGRHVSQPVSGAGAVFWNVRVLEVDEYHSLAAALNCDGLLPDLSTNSAATAKSKRGRPKHNDFEAFIAELVRRADLDGLPETRRELKKQMLDWLGETFSDHLPSDSSVDTWLKTYAPHRL